MVFKEYKTAGYKKQIRDLLRKRLDLKERVRYHKKKVQYHLEKIDKIEKVKLIDVEKALQKYLDRAK